jgi:hypothetical protein
MASLSGAIVGSLIMTFIPELLAPLETGITVFGIQLPELYGASNLILAALLILIIIYRRQGIMGYNEIITDSLFSIKTYTSILKKSEYINLYTILINMPKKLISTFAAASKTDAVKNKKRKERRSKNEKNS